MQSKPSVLLRQQILIDEHVQGSLLRRIALYSTACAVYFVVILVFAESMSTPEEPLWVSLYRCLDEVIYWAPGLMLLTPMMAYDLLKVTNRFAGPIFRLRREMQRLVDGESVHPVCFRDGDFWIEMADIFNQLRDEVISLREEQARQSGAQSGDEDVVSQEKLFDADDDGQDLADNLFVKAGG